MKLSEFVFPKLTSFTGNIGFYFKDLQDKEILEINGERVFSAASVIKIPLCLEVLEQCTQGRLDLSSDCPITKSNRVGGTGVIQNLNERYIPTLAELITLAISVSDNIATNELIDIVGGPQAVNNYCEKQGMKATRLQRKMLDLEARKAGKDNWMNVKEMGGLLENICNIVYGSDLQQKAKILPLFKGMVMQQCRNKIPAKVPAMDYYDVTDTYLPSAQEVLVANKTGDLWSTQNDVAICTLPNSAKYILAICTDELEVAQNGIELIGDLSKAVYTYMLEKYAL